MTFTWDEGAEAIYETGVSRGILVPHGGDPVVWNGLAQVAVNPSGGEYEPYYFDGVKYMDAVLAEDFEGVITAISTPREFDACDGIKTLVTGMQAPFQRRQKFNLAWRTEIGSQLDQNLGYKIHILYNAKVLPTTKTYATISDQTTPDIRSWTVKTTPACGRLSYYVFDSRDVDLSALEAQLEAGVFPACSELLGLLDVTPTDPDTGCPSVLTDLEQYVSNQTLDEDVVTDTSETFIYGLVNPGLNTAIVPTNATYAANDSAATETGAGAILNDQDDATFVDSATGDLGYTMALDPMIGYAPGSKLELHIRLSLSGDVDPDDPDNIDADAQVFITTDPGGDTPIGGFSDGTDDGMSFSVITVDGSINDYVVPLDLTNWPDNTIDDVVTALQAGAYLNVVAINNNNPDPAATPEAKVYEALVMVIDDTEPGKVLRAISPTDSGHIEQHVYSSGTIDYAKPTTSTVDFKLIQVQHNPDVSGDTQQIMEYSTQKPGLMQIELASGSPVVKWYKPDLATVLETASLDPNMWYTAEVWWVYGGVRVRVWLRENYPLGDPILDHTDSTLSSANDPVAYSKHFAGMVGDSDVTYEVMIDNARMQVHCHEETPTSGGTPAFLHPGAITWDAPSGIFDTGSITGSLPLQDGSDSTYIGIETDGDGTDVTYINRALAPVYESYVGSPTQMTVRIRADVESNDPSGGARLSIAIEDSDGSPAVVISPGTFDWVLADTGHVIEDFTLVMTDAYFAHWGTTLSAIAAILAAGTAKFVIQINVSTTGTAVHSFIHLYHVEVELD